MKFKTAAAVTARLWGRNDVSLWTTQFCCCCYCCFLLLLFSNETLVSRLNKSSKIYSFLTGGLENRVFSSTRESAKSHVHTLFSDTVLCVCLRVCVCVCVGGRERVWGDVSVCVSPYSMSFELHSCETPFTGTCLPKGRAGAPGNRGVDERSVGNSCDAHLTVHRL